MRLCPTARCVSYYTLPSLFKLSRVSFHGAHVDTLVAADRLLVGLDSINSDVTDDQAATKPSCHSRALRRYSTLGGARQIRDASGPEGRKRARDAQHSKQAVARPAGDRAAGNNRAQWRYAAVVRSGGVVDHAKTSKHRCRTSSLPLIHDANDAAMWTPPGDPIEHRHEQMGGSGAIVTGRSALTDHPGYFQTVGTLGDVTF